MTHSSELQKVWCSGVFPLKGQQCILKGVVGNPLVILEVDKVLIVDSLLGGFLTQIPSPDNTFPVSKAGISTNHSLGAMFGMKDGGPQSMEVQVQSLCKVGKN